METKETDTKGGKDWNKTRKILALICLVLLAIVAFRKWSRGAGTDGGTAGQTTSNAVTVIAENEHVATAESESASTSSPSASILSDSDSPEQTASPASPEQEAAAAASQATAAGSPSTPQAANGTAPAASAKIAEDGLYTSKEDVALYIHTYGHLPANFISKAEAKELGWGDRYGSVDEAAPGKSIGGDRFGNREGLLPKKKGRTYTECDIGTMGKKSRGAKRIVFSNDGLVYYTGDHYETFELLYGSE